MANKLYKLAVFKKALILALGSTRPKCKATFGVLLLNPFNFQIILLSLFPFSNVIAHLHIGVVGVLKSVAFIAKLTAVACSSVFLFTESIRAIGSLYAYYNGT
jgi:hypothetical protein